MRHTQQGVWLQIFKLNLIYWKLHRPFEHECSRFEKTCADWLFEVESTELHGFKWIPMDEKHSPAILQMFSFAIEINSHVLK